MQVTIIGAGLAGCEAAWQLASFGLDVKLYEMKPIRFSAAHQSEQLAELVCSNSLRAAAVLLILTYAVIHCRLSTAKCWSYIYM